MQHQSSTNDPPIRPASAPTHPKTLYRLYNLKFETKTNTNFSDSTFEISKLPTMWLNEVPPMFSL
jgi:hypothetical protein